MLALYSLMSAMLGPEGSWQETIFALRLAAFAHTLGQSSVASNITIGLLFPLGAPSPNNNYRPEAQLNVLRGSLVALAPPRPLIAGHFLVDASVISTCIFMLNTGMGG